MIKVKKLKDNWGSVKKQLESLSKLDVLVGIPQAEEREDGEITNAQLLFIQSKGSPVNNIPPRPTLEPTVSENKARISEMYRKSIEATLNGQNGRAELEKIGLWTSTKVKDKFGSDELVPNAPITIKKKGSDRPLIDTGQLRNAVTYVIRNKA